MHGIGWYDPTLYEGNITNIVIALFIALFILFTKKIIDFLYKKNIPFPWYTYIALIIVNIIIDCIILCYFVNNPVIIGSDGTI